MTDPATVDSVGELDSPTELGERLRAGIRDVPDYPNPGILFKDVTPLLADPALFDAALTGLITGFG